MHSMKDYCLWVEIVILQLIATVLSQVFCAYEPFLYTFGFFPVTFGQFWRFPVIPGNCLAENLLLLIGISV